MKSARFVVLGIALAAGISAAYLARGTSRTPAPSLPAQPTLRTVEVLVTTSDIGMGSTVKEENLRWQTWPADSLPAYAITKRDTAEAVADLTGTIARASIASGDLVRRESLIKANGSGFMSAMLPSGKRAMAITIDSRGSSSAGGFILPNDRVDVIRTYRSEQQGSNETILAQTILQNIRVLAIGQIVQEKASERVVSGENATLEVDPRQAEILTRAQKNGQLSLVLRSLTDADVAAVAIDPEDSMTIVRFGVASQTGGR
ncbi:MAG: Flp pilus assembly protein CpaB [Chelatococcus sp.]|uniref:Flp pilus assembly protein CpaB n=1 Tax=Chelatococcus sp. TaxID=1953771 RepID=UPI0025B80377|nr:Flp pilus assembly protein CpaB [Chelatococcus sp.]MBX3536861.1 Flp pilus assembly protein CpaB [Chelatococcus sp.]